MKAELKTRFPNVPDDCIGRWLDSFRHHRLSDPQKEEVLHYLTEEQVLKCIVCTQAEHEYLVSQHQQPSVLARLPTPVETFGEKPATPPCVKCKSRDTTFFAIQNRSSDEPTSYFFQCNSCMHSWKCR